MGRNANGIKQAIVNVAGKEAIGTTKGELLENLNKQYLDVDLTIAVVDGNGDAIASPTITLKKGATEGSGDAVSASNDVYLVKYGKYNYSIAKTNYTTKTGVIDVTLIDVDAESKTATVELVLAPVAPTITTTTLTNATAETAYSAELAATGDEPITWALNAGSSLPAWLSLNESAGVLSGTPTEAAAAVSFTVKATNATGSDTQELTITVDASAE